MHPKKLSVKCCKKRFAYEKNAKIHERIHFRKNSKALQKPLETLSFRISIKSIKQINREVKKNNFKNRTEFFRSLIDNYFKNEDSYLPINKSCQLKNTKKDIINCDLRVDALNNEHKCSYSNLSSKICPAFTYFIEES